MSTLPYLDIHTHCKMPVEGSVWVESLSVDDLAAMARNTGHFTAGIHPWWIEEFSAQEIGAMQGQIKEFLEKGLLWGIGETGLDRSMPELMEKQRELFFWHFDLAEMHRLPLVIHNVRAGSDFLEIMKNKRPSTPWIFHDFRGNEQLMLDLLRLHPQCYFSFGLSIDNSPQVRELLPLVPIENVFLETDDQKHLDIHDIYLRASEHMKVELDLLKSQIWLNFKKVSRSIQ